MKVKQIENESNLYGLLGAYISDMFEIGAWIDS